MKVLLTGASGLIGSELARTLRALRHEVVPLSRKGHAPQQNAGVWDPATGQIEVTGNKDWDGLVHLAGESIAGIWTAKKKSAIRHSRAEPTHKLCEFLAQTSRTPRVMVCASAIGYYGDRGEEVLTEESRPGTGFLPKVCRQWEEATQVARHAGIRVVNTRFGMALSARGGALRQMLPAFRLGLGGKIGTGQQFWSWIALCDLVAAIEHCLTCDTIVGPVNVVSPEPSRNAAFTKALGRALGRPTVLTVPRFAARLVLGQMADELLLASARVEPRQLLSAGFKFRQPQLDGAFRNLL
jgi:uncharacterized protein (TIGR01777 family)